MINFAFYAKFEIMRIIKLTFKRRNVICFI